MSYETALQEGGMLSYETALQEGRILSYETALQEGGILSYETFTGRRHTSCSFRHNFLFKVFCCVLLL